MAQTIEGRIKLEIEIETLLPEAEMEILECIDASTTFDNDDEVKARFHCLTDRQILSPSKNREDDHVTQFTLDHVTLDETQLMPLNKTTAHCTLLRKKPPSCHVIGTRSCHVMKLLVIASFNKVPNLWRIGS
jgi:hypothetical protein